VGKMWKKDLKCGKSKKIVDLKLK